MPDELLVKGSELDVSMLDRKSKIYIFFKKISKLKWIFLFDRKNILFYSGKIRATTSRIQTIWRQWIYARQHDVEHIVIQQSCRQQCRRHCLGRVIADHIVANSFDWWWFFVFLTIYFNVVLFFFKKRFKDCREIQSFSNIERCSCIYYQVNFLCFYLILFILLFFLSERNLNRNQWLLNLQQHFRQKF